MQRLRVLTMIAAGIWVVSGCKKAKNSAVVEEVPAATAVSDSATAMPEEPSLQKIAPTPSKSSNSEGNFDPKGRFVVQVGVFRSKVQAKHLKEKLSAAGYPAYTAEVESPTPELSGTYHRVRVGRFATLEAAHDFGKNTLKAQGYEYWVDKKSNDHVGGGSSSESVTPAYSAPASTDSYSSPGSSSSSPTTSFTSEPSSSPSPATSTPAPVEPATPPAPEPVGVPEPPAPAPSEPTASPDKAMGNPLPDTASASGTSVPKTAKDSAGAVEGW